MVPILVWCIRFGVLLTGRVCTVESCILISEQGSGIFIQCSSHLFVLKQCCGGNFYFLLWPTFLNILISRRLRQVLLQLRLHRMITDEIAKITHA
jgi:hypothetical protein